MFTLIVLAVIKLHGCYFVQFWISIIRGPGYVCIIV